MDEQNFVAPEGDEYGEFVADSPKGVIKQQGTGGTSSTVGGERSASAPQDEIAQHRDIAYTDPHVHEAVFTLLDWVTGDGYNISPGPQFGEGSQNTEEGEIITRLRRLFHNSNFWTVFNDWVYYAIVDGHSFMELVVEDEQFKPKLLPTERMKRKTDEYGNVTEYVLDSPDSGGGDGGDGGDEGTPYKPHEVAELYFRKEPTEDFGRSFIESIAESANILRDMEIDYARFIATKAYPPILWKLGSDEEKWTEGQMKNWMGNIEEIGPDSMLFGPHDVEFEVVGTTSTSSTAGAMRLEETFDHFQDRIITGLGVPALIMNMEGGGNGQGEAVSTMPSYKRRVRRLQNIIKEHVEQQILKSILTESAGLETFEGVLPEFEFGEYSSAEERLDADQAINLLNNGLLTPEAAARRAGIDPQDELPEVWNENDLMTVLNALASTGDNIQNPQGGNPTNTGGGAESAGGEATTRDDAGADSQSSRNKSSVTEDEG